MDGLIQVSGCNNPNRQVDLVFVHGLDGDATLTWCSNGDRNKYWPRWLGEQEPAIGVWSLGYAVSSFAWKGYTMPLIDRATNILGLIELQGIGSRRIICVCHSLGGLLVKQILRTAGDSADAKYKRIASQTTAIVS